MKNFLRITLTAAALMMGQGCAYSVHQVYIGSMDPNARYSPQARWVEAEKKQFVLLGFQFNSDYVQDAYKDLQSKCPGRLAQVTTEHMTEFLLLSYNQKVILKGLCSG